MKKNTLAIKSGLKAGGLTGLNSSNHNRLAIKSGLKAGGLVTNHNRAALAI
jgi:hypothetical protein